MIGIGDRVSIISANHERNRFEIEGEGVVVAKMSRPYRYLVRFAGSNEVVERRVDPVAQAIGAAAYVAFYRAILTSTDTMAEAV